MLPVARWIHAVAERAPSALALQAADGDFDYAAFARRIDAVAAALASAGIGAGERVAWLGLNSAGLLATLFACAARGAILAPLNWRLAPPEHRALLERTAPALLVAELLCWIYPVIAFIAGSFAWAIFNMGGHHAFPLMLAPIAWLVIMGIVFAIVDYAEDGILGNARERN